MKAFCGDGDELSSTIGLHEVMGYNVLRIVHFFWCFNEYGEAKVNYKSTCIQFRDVIIFLTPFLIVVMMASLKFSVITSKFRVDLLFVPIKV
jgi:hypothetical protein